MTTAETAHLVPVAVEKESALKRRRVRLDITQQQLADEAGVIRDTISAVEAGGGSARSRHKVADALTRLEEEAGLAPIDEPPASPPSPTPTPEGKDKVVRFIVKNVYGAEALIVEVPPENVGELEQAVDRIMKRLQAGSSED